MKKTVLDNSYVIDIPFNLSTKGKVNSIIDTAPKVWRNKLLALLSTGINERIWYYVYGANLNSLIFETSDQVVEDARAAISQLFVTWLPDLNLSEVDAEIDPDNAAVIFTIIYSLPSGELDSVKISTSSLNNAGETLEVL
jgi:phage baseplate assembly protein W